MKTTKRILALITALLLALSLTGCLTPKDDEGTEPSDPDVPTAIPDSQNGGGSDEPDPAGEDTDAVAIELGDYRITAGEIANVFDQYIGMFSYSGTVDEETVSQCIEMSVDYVLRYYVPLWKADELGVTLNEAEEAEIEAAARADVEEEREDLICRFAYYYGISEEFPASSDVLTEEETEAVMDAINGELADVFYEGFTFDQYLDQQYESYRKDRLVDKLTARLREQSEANLAVDAEAVDAWYEETLETQRTGFDEVPSEYRNVAEDFASGESTTPVLYVPAGFARIQVLEFVPDGDPDERIETNNAVLKMLEAEYGALALNGEDEARQAEIRAQYGALLEENRTMEDAYYADVMQTVKEADAALKGGMSFEDAMDAFNRHEEGASGMDERLVYIGGADTRYGDLAAEAAKLSPGEISEPVAIDGAYYIIRMVGVVPEGVVDRASIEDAVNAAALADNAEDAWEALFDSWVAEARDVAVFHPETYENIGDFYLGGY
jgi:hypothetical protein